jgi:hypothetical protein
LWIRASMRPRRFTCVEHNQVAFTIADQLEE